MASYLDKGYAGDDDSFMQKVLQSLFEAVARLAGDDQPNLYYI